MLFRSQTILFATSKVKCGSGDGLGQSIIGPWVCLCLVFGKNVPKWYKVKEYSTFLCIFHKALFSALPFSVSLLCVRSKSRFSFFICECVRTKRSLCDQQKQDHCLVWSQSEAEMYTAPHFLEPVYEAAWSNMGLALTL